MADIILCSWCPTETQSLFRCLTDICHLMPLWKRSPSKDLSWPENTGHVQISVVFARLCVVLLSTFMQIHICFDFELIRQKPCLLSNNESKKKIGSWHYVHFCHVCQPSSWCHIYRIPDIKQWQWCFFATFKHRFNKNLDHKFKSAVFIPFTLIGPMNLLHFCSPLWCLVDS